MEDVFVPSTWKRLFATGIDQLISLLFYLPFAKLFFRLFFSDSDVFVSLPQLLALFLIPAVYELVFLVILQATPGKWLLGLKVVPFNNAYEKLHWSQCVLRPLVGRLSFFFSWAIYAMAFFRYDRTHLADWIAETRVIQFHPRAARVHVRWLLGIILVLGYLYQGLNYSTAFLHEIDWKNRKVELHAVMDNADMTDFDFEFGSDEE